MIKHIKKLFIAVISSMLGMTILGGCSTNYAQEDNTHFVIDYSFSVSKDFHLVLNVKNVIDLSKDEFYNRYLKADFDELMDRYTFDGFTYSNGNPYVFDAAQTSEYINQSINDNTYDSSYFEWNYHYTWFLTIVLTPKVFDVQYVGYENDSRFDEYRTYSVDNLFNILTIEKDYYQHIGWKEQNSDVVKYNPVKIDAFGYKNLVIEPVFEENTYSIGYTLPFEIENPNPVSFKYTDDIIHLIPFDDHPSGGYTFVGFFENDKEITIIDTKHPINHTIEARFNIPEYHASYYVDEALLITKTFTYLNIDEYEEPSVPNKEHYHNARWSERVSSFKNYVINALYDIDTFVVSISNNAGLDIQNKNIEFGSTLENLYEELENIQLDNKSFVGLFTDENHNEMVNKEMAVTSNLSLFAYWEDIIHLSTYDDLSIISSSFQGTYVLDNDISCVGQSLPILSSFNGVFDGNGHSIKRFSNTNLATDNNFAIFGINNGTIKNVTFEDGTFVSGNTANSNETCLGMITSINRGTIDNVDCKSCTASFSLRYNIYINYISNVYSRHYSGLFSASNEGTIAHCVVDEETKITFDSSYSYTRDTGRDGYSLNGDAYYGTFAGVNPGTIQNVEAYNSLTCNKISIGEAVADWQDNYFSSVNYNMCMGGICGYNNSLVEKSISEANIESSYNVPIDMKKTLSSNAYIGGISGYNAKTIRLCHTTDKAYLFNQSYANMRLGGISGGSNSNSVIRSCYSEGDFKVGNRLPGSEIYVGGILGLNYGILSYCHASVTSIEQVTTTNTIGAIGSLVGASSETSSATYCLGYINLTEEYLLSDCYDFGSLKSGAIISNVSIYAPEQDTVIEKIDNVNSLTSLEALIAQAERYYFDETGFTLFSDKLPVLDNIGR